MRKIAQILSFLAIGLFVWLGLGKSVSAQQIIPTYSTGKVVNINKIEQFDQDGKTFYVQEVDVVESETGEVFTIPVGTKFQPLTETQLLVEGEQVVLSEQEIMVGQKQKAVSEIYRIPKMMWLALGFFALVLVVSGLKGFMSALGMVFSLGILIEFVVPQLLSGANPILVSLAGAAIIGSITVYLSHGWSVKSHIALGSIMATLLVVTLLSSWYVILTKLVGLGSEEAYFLQFGETAKINLQGLLIGGMMLGALGVLDDVCVSQVSIVFELKKANKKLNFQKLFESGMKVGRDHVASLVNTLVLAYAGANFPLFLLFITSTNVPTWVNINSQILAEEIVRTLVGSIGLVLAVPLTTALSAYFAQKISKEKLSDGHIHRH